MAVLAPTRVDAGVGVSEASRIQGARDRCLALAVDVTGHACADKPGALAEILAIRRERSARRAQAVVNILANDAWYGDFHDSPGTTCREEPLGIKGFNPFTPRGYRIHVSFEIGVYTPNKALATRTYVLADTVRQAQV